LQQFLIKYVTSQLLEETRAVRMHCILSCIIFTIKGELVVIHPHLLTPPPKLYYQTCGPVSFTSISLEDLVFYLHKLKKFAIMFLLLSLRCKTMHSAMVFRRQWTQPEAATINPQRAPPPILASRLQLYRPLHLHSCVPTVK
jgi:hypothetical protein